VIAEQSLPGVTPLLFYRRNSDITLPIMYPGRFSCDPLESHCGLKIVEN
jgi:hypothetical protein